MLYVMYIRMVSVEVWPFSIPCVWWIQGMFVIMNIKIKWVWGGMLKVFLYLKQKSIQQINSINFNPAIICINQSQFNNYIQENSIQHN